MSGKRLLIAEDERHIQLTLKLYLQSRGFKVQVTDNGLQAWELLNGSKAGNQGWDLVLTDIKMPEMTGVELLEKMRDHGINIPVVVMTGYSEDISIERLKEIGCFSIVRKPFSPSKIESVIVEALACRQSGGDWS